MKTAKQRVETEPGAESGSEIWATLNYLAPNEQHPRRYMDLPPPEGEPRMQGELEGHPMSIHNARQDAVAPKLDTHGFQIVEHTTQVAELYDEAAVKQHYFPEAEQLVVDALGAESAFAFDHNVRCAPMADRGEAKADYPVQICHNDYTLSSGPRRVRELFPDDAEARLKKRFAQINLWRPIRGPVLDVPLAVCDGRSIQPNDFATMEMIYSDRVGYVNILRHNPNHRWSYFPRMQRDEVLILKGFDSADDGRTRFSAHSAFEDPSAAPDSPARESIEIRLLVFFPD
ncbi:MAG: methyltransferase [Gammaproteobacteria bacterium]|nr:methyltransferase [Gammaproteobacteria bacterium]